VQPTSSSFTTTYVVPAHNSVRVLEGTLGAIRQRLVSVAPAEVVVVENGSSDGTVDLLDKIAQQWPDVDDGVALTVLSVEKGLGNAVREGLLASRGDRVVLTADDLPFGFDEFDAAAGMDMSACQVVVGSKDHRASDVGRSIGRSVLTGGFKLLRAVILRMRTGDPQGTYVLDGPWVRSIAPLLQEPGFLCTTELTYIAELGGIRPVEVPVRLRAAEEAYQSRIRLADPIKMGLGLFGLRMRRRALLSGIQGAATAAATTAGQR
jgi:dolichyl-phosphate beta-glucosyltransferase